MKNKKNPNRFSIQFDPNIPEHKTVIDILLQKERYASKYIAEAILFYEKSKCDSLEGTVMQIITEKLGLSSLPAAASEIPTADTSDNIIDFNEISMDLEGFKK